MPSTVRALRNLCSSKLLQPIRMTVRKLVSK
jgi:hypothetical protein